MNFSRKHHKINRCFVNKNQLNFRCVFLVLITMCFITVGFQSLNAQNKVRLKANYVKIMNGESYIDITATSKIKKQNTKVSNIDIDVYNVVGEEKINLGNIQTNKDGQGRFIIKNLNTVKLDSTNIYNFFISFKGNDSFKKTSKRISFKNADIEAKIITIHGINNITATLTGTSSETPIINEPLNVQLQRLFRPLIIGKEFYNTDDNGAIVVPIEEGLSGVDGVLTFEVVLDDSDEFGTVKAIVNAPIGVPIVDESTFDQRTMWSPPTKTPIFLWIFPNLLILGVWGTIVYLIINLFKISKS